MAKYVQLLKLVEKFRAETGQSILVSAGLDDLPAQQNCLRRTQNILYQNYDWPHLRVERTIQLQAGQRFYDLPNDLDYERIEEIVLWQNGQPSPLDRGIDSTNYAAVNSLTGERSSPVQCWDIKWTETTEQMEVWPIPDNNDDFITITGIRKLRDMISDSDVCDLDDDLIVLHAAAEVLADQKAGNTQAVSGAAMKLDRLLRGRSAGASSSRVIMRGNNSDGASPARRSMILTVK